ncbi:hypothetical protein [Nocardia niigatensis]|uniref:hypothetical protein n=1 Tax=Nocardia niigatensis TaxID=209249 RepID=UPI0002F9A637|nr:hypothetical protein [Nocardia niigatensis]
MTTTDVLLPWDSFFGGNFDQIFRGQFGSCLVKDYDGVTNWANWTPFDPLTGEIKSTFYTNGQFADGWVDLGYGDKSGIKFTQNITVNQADPWQSRREEDPNITKQSESGVFTALQSNPVIDALQDGLPLASMPSVGTIGYSYGMPRFPQVVYRTVAFMGMRVTRAGLLWMKWRLFPCATMLKPGETEWAAENGEKTVLTFEPHECQVSGSARFVLEDGPGWRALGGATLAPGTPVAAATGSGGVTLSMTAPMSPNGPFTYKAFRTSAPTTPITPASVGGTAANPILTLSGQATGAATYTVQAIGSNGTTSPQSAASNSVTVA